MKLTIAIPTYMREKVLIETCARILQVMDPVSMELVVLDHSPSHEEWVREQLSAWQKKGFIRLIQFESDSLTCARNLGLREARSEVVLFLDDDVMISDRLLANHMRWYTNPEVVAVVGESYNCINPDQPPPLSSPGQGTRRHSHMTAAGPTVHIVGNNHSVRRDHAIGLGGYDEQFVGSSLGEDLDFSERLRMGNGMIWYDPEAWLIHLAARRGGCAVIGVATKLEWTHSANLMLCAFRHGFRRGNFKTLLWMALRNGPLRKENVLKPWRWPVAWWGFIKGMIYGWRHRRFASSEVLRLGS